MSKGTLIVLVTCLLVAASVIGSHDSGEVGHQAPDALPVPPAEEVGQMDLELAMPSFDSGFEENIGQLSSPEVRFFAHGRGLSVFLGVGWMAYDVRAEEGSEGPTGALVRIAFHGCNPVEPSGTEELGHLAHYFLGSSPQAWTVNARSFSGVSYTDLWDGIDLKFYFSSGLLKYDLVVKPGGRPSAIRMTYEGVKTLEVDERTGALNIYTAAGTVTDDTPRSFQEVGEVLVDVESSYLLKDERSVGFQVGTYLMDVPLVIDPGLLDSTFIGGSGGDEVMDMFLDASDQVYLTGATSSTDFPTTLGAYNTSFAGSSDVFVLKFNKTRQKLLFSTYIGGMASDEPYAIQVDGSGNVYVAGLTSSADFPTTPSAYDTSHNGRADAFVFKLNASGSSLHYSTYIGGENVDHAYGMYLNETSCPTVVGWTSSSDFPTTIGVLDRTYNGPPGLWEGDGFVARLNATGGSLVASTFLGGTGSDLTNDVSVDEHGSVYVCGMTEGGGFPVTTGAYDTSHNGDMDGYVVKMNGACSALLYSTFFGGSDFDDPMPFYVDSTDRVILAGYTSSNDFPTSNDAYDTIYNGGGDGFVLALDLSTSSLEFSTYVGGTGEEGFMDFCLDENGSLYLTGMTTSGDYPISPDAYDTNYNGGRWDVMLTRLAANATYVDYSTYIGGALGAIGEEIAQCIVFDGSDTVLLAGRTESSDFPVAPAAFDSTFDGTSDGFFLTLQTGFIIADPPGVPRNLTAVGGDKMVTLSWDPPEDDGGIPITGYRVYRGDAEGNLTVFTQVEVDVLGITNRMLVNERTYYYSVCARNVKGFGPRTPVVNATPRGPPGAVTDVVAVAGCRTVHLSWSPPSDTGGVPILGYWVLRSTNGIDFTHSVELGNVTELLDMDLVASQPYHYMVCAFTIMGNGSLSGKVQAIPYDLPGAPAALVAVAGDGYVSLEWQTPERTGGRPIEGYRLYRNTSGEAPELVTALGDVITYRDEDVENGVEYRYALGAVNLAGEGPWVWAGPVIPAGLPGAPEDFAVVAATDQVTLSWSTPSRDGGSPLLGYMVYRGLDPIDLILIELMGPGTSYLDAGLDNGQPFHYQVRAYTLVGEGPPTPTLEAIPMGRATAPSPVFVEEGAGRLVVHWTRPRDDGGSAITGYELLKGEDPDAMAPLRTLAPFTMMYEDLSVTNGTTHYYAVAAYTAFDRGLLSETVSGMPFGLPGPPTALTLVQEGDAAVLGWEPPSDDGWRPVTAFRVYRGSSLVGMTLLTELGNVKSFVDATTQPGEAYSYAVAAVNEAGEGPRCQSADILVVGLPGAPLSLAVQNVDGSVVLSWTPPSSDGGAPVTSYLVLRGPTVESLEVHETPGMVQTFTDTEVEPATRYYYAIVAVNTRGEGEPTPPLLVQTPKEKRDQEDTGPPNWWWLAILLVAAVGVLLMIALMRSRGRVGPSTDRDGADQREAATEEQDPSTGHEMGG